MRKRKERDRRKKTLDAGVYPVVRLTTKAHGSALSVGLLTAVVAVTG